MDSITLGQIVEVLAFIAGGIGSVATIYKVVAKAFKKSLDNALSPLNKKLDELERKHDLSDREQAKNFIVRFLADVEQGEPIDKDELHCFWDNYELYKAMGGNSYVHDKVEKLKAEGKL